MKKRILATLIVILLLAVGVTGCNKDKPPNEVTLPQGDITSPPKNIALQPDDVASLPPDMPTLGQPFKAAFISQTVLVPYQLFSWREFQRLAPGYGFNMYSFFANADVGIETAGIERAILDEYDAIFINPTHIAAIIPALEKAKEAGLIVCMFTTELPREYQHLQDFWVDSDAYLGAKQAGEFVVTAFPDGANVVEVGGQANHVAQIARRNGFRAGVEGSNVTILASQNCSTGWEPDEAKVIMKEFIEKYGDQIDIVFCHWDNGATGVIEALHNAGMYDVRIIGMDGNSTGYQQVRDGHQWLSVGVSYTNLVIKSLENTKILLEGGTVPEVNNIPWDMVTLETIDSFRWPVW